jgi:hypothetical protein
LALLALVVGVGHLGIAIAVGFRFFTYERAGGGSAIPPGELLERGLFLILFAVVLGTLGEIGMALQRAYPKQ